MLVAQVLIRHTDELESDLLMHFGIDLRDLFTGRLSFRRLGVLINRLVGMYGQSAVSVALLGEAARWSNTEYLIADLIDRVEILNWLTTEIHKSPNTSNPIPEPHPRPGMSREGGELINTPESEPQMATAQDLSDWFAKLT